MSTYKEFTAPTRTIDSTHPFIEEFVNQHVTGVSSDIEQGVRLYYAVRDIIRYNPYQINLTVLGMKASTTVESKRGWCVSKSLLLAACCRSIGIPARLGFADVRNHLSTNRLRERMGTDIFYWHGYTEMLLAGKWVKATPAFNIRLCEKFRLLPLEFDGQNDSLYHPYDEEGHRHIEYIKHRGVYPDLPLKKIIQTYQKKYSFTNEQPKFNVEGFDEDVVLENQR